MEKFNLVSEVSLNKEVQASIENPTLTRLSFVFTDNQPNGNKKGIPTSAFPNIIKTGVFMPIKMAEGEIGIDHTGAVPLGVIASLKENPLSEDIYQVVGNAVLWNEERPDDTQFIKSAFASGDKLNISWELLYSSSETDENGTEWLLDPIVRAATFVGLPAYGGRTPITAVASLETSPTEPREDGTTIEGNPESQDVNQGNSAMTLEELQAKVAELETQLAEAKAALENKESEKDQELASLREFKASIEKKEADAALLQARLETFASAGITFTPEEIEAKKANWLKMDDEQFSFLVEELKVRQPANSSLQTKVPDRVSTPDLTNSIEIVKNGLRELRSKK